MALGMFMNVMSLLMRVIRPLPVCALYLCVWWCSGVFFYVSAFCVSFVSYSVMMSGELGAVYEVFSSSILFLMPFMLI